MNASVLFTMGNQEEQIVRSVIANCEFRVVEPEIFSFRKLGAILSLLDLFISNDCGPMHLAPAVGTKTIGIFGPGEPEIWFPYSADLGHRFVRHEVSCSRCHRDFCENMECMKDISVEDVFSAVRDSLNHSRKK
jgi:ADP-heptose:LPS heptosyltransferase